MRGGRRLRPIHWVIGSLVLLGLLLPPLLAPPAKATSRRSPSTRLLGPVSDLAASIQWVRFQRARLDGRQELAIARAESALGFAPEATAGWELFAAHLALLLGSPEREPDPARRLDWFRAGLAVARRGEEQAERGGDLVVLRAVLFSTKAEMDSDLPWPGGVPAMWEEAALAYARAAELEAHPLAADLAEIAREMARETAER
jgi:hypothetical protein